MAETTLIYGATDSWKTSNLGFAAQYLFEISGGKPVRLISSDGGQYKPIKKLISAGIIEPLWIPSCPQPLIMYRKLSEGFWPLKIEDGRMIGFDLVPPAFSSASMVSQPSGAFTVSKDSLMLNDLSKYSGYIVEGLTSISDRIMEDLRTNQRKIAEDSVGNFQLTLGQAGTPGAITEKFANNSRAHFGFCQREVMVMVIKYAQLPVLKVLFSAHEAQGEEEDTKQPIRGPGLAGKAATGKVLKDIGSILHFEIYSEEVKAAQPLQPAITKTTVKAFYRTHPDQIMTQLKYPAKPRVPPNMIKELEKRLPGGYFIPGENYGEGLDRYLRIEDELSEGVDQGLLSWVQAIKNPKAVEAKK